MTYRFTAHCKCGASWDVRTSVDEHEFWHRMWVSFHSRPECGPATASQAGAIRRRQAAFNPPAAPRS